MKNDYDLKDLIERLEEARAKSGLSMRAVSLESNLAPPTYHGIVKLGKEPGAATLMKICDTLKVSAAWALYGTEITAEAEEILGLLQKHPAKREAILALLRG